MNESMNDALEKLHMRGRQWPFAPLDDSRTSQLLLLRRLQVESSRFGPDEHRC